MSRRTPWIVTGIVVLVVATPVVIAGIVLLALFGSRGDLRSGPHQVTTPGRALISSVAEIKDTGDAGFLLGDSRLELAGTARNAGHGVFVGIAPAAAPRAGPRGPRTHRRPGRLGGAPPRGGWAPPPRGRGRRRRPRLRPRPLHPPPGPRAGGGGSRRSWCAGLLGCPRRGPVRHGLAVLDRARRGLPRRHHERRREPRGGCRRHLRRRYPSRVRTEHGGARDRPGHGSSGRRPAPGRAAAAGPPRPARAGSRPTSRRGAGP